MIGGAAPWSLVALLSWRALRKRDPETFFLALHHELVIVGKIAQIPLMYHPGERWYYSASVDIQGYIVEKLSGQTLGDPTFLEYVVDVLDRR